MRKITEEDMSEIDKNAFDEEIENSNHCSQREGDEADLFLLALERVQTATEIEERESPRATLTAATK